jgi:hypothetical protein
VARGLLEIAKRKGRNTDKKSPDAALQSARVVDKILKSESFAVEVDGRLVVIPIQNVRTVEGSPSPGNLPPQVVKGARLM